MIEFKNLEKIKNLRSIAREALSKHIDRDYVLLDIPNHRNIGDLLIWQGELEFFRKLDNKVIYSSNIYTHNDDKIGNNDIILLHGGGNFGDVWRTNQEYRNKIIQKYSNHRIIILPQTIFYHDKEKIKIDQKLYRQHPDLTICTRDKVSYELAKKYFKENNILLLPDMAFFNDFSRFHTDQQTHRSLLMLRQDKELGNEDLINKIKNELLESGRKLDIKDWPGFYEKGTMKQKAQGIRNKYASKAEKKLAGSVLDFLVDDIHGLKRRDYKNYKIDLGINFMNQYDEIYSTRLHGFILGILLNKKVNIFDNSYGKNKNFYNTWLQDFENIELIEG